MTFRLIYAITRAGTGEGNANPKPDLIADGAITWNAGAEIFAITRVGIVVAGVIVLN